MNRKISGWRRSVPVLTCSLGAIAFSCGLARAQDAQEDQAADDDVVIVEQAQRPADERVVVIGERTRSALVREAGRETENFYRLLNQVLERPEFEIRCVNEYPPNSNILQRVCRTRYQERLESRAALSARQGFGVTDEGEMVFSGSSFNQATDLLVMQREFEDAVLDAVNTDPGLNESVLRLMALKDAIDNYESPREQARQAEE
jgi:hypothetical protein